MKKSLTLLYSVVALIIFIILVWYVSIPTSLIKEKLIETISASAGPDIRTEITGLSKGPLFGLHFESIDIYSGDKHVIRITDLSLKMNPVYLYKKNLAVTIKGKLGSGDIHGSLQLPDGGIINIDNIGLDSIPYLKSLGIKSRGSLSAEAILKKDSLEGRFMIEGLNLEESPFSMIPLIDSFRKVQGVITLSNKIVTINSLSLDGEKAYARVKGNIRNGLADMTFELMPEFRELENYEKMLIKKYESSPGHYVIPFRRRVRL